MNYTTGDNGMIWRYLYGGTLKSSILKGFFVINRPFCGIPIDGNHIISWLIITHNHG